MPGLKVNSESKIVNRNSIDHLPFTIYKRKGFTLIELLVVIALIGILASFGVYSLNSAQQKGRDARRKSDLNAVKKAMELARQDCTGGTYYPTIGGWDEYNRYDNAQSHLSASALNYMKKVPDDPKDSGTLKYALYVSTQVASNVCLDTLGNRNVGGSVDFTLKAVLENTNDPDDSASFNRCSGRPGVPGVDPGNTYFVCND